MREYNGFTSEQRAKAQVWLNGRYACAAVQRPRVCVHGCHQRNGLIMHHTEDYSQPFGPHIHAYDLCYLCHITLHCRFNNPWGWLRYVTAVREGFRGPNPAAANFGLTMETLKMFSDPIGVTDPAKLPLDAMRASGWKKYPSRPRCEFFASLSTVPEKFTHGWLCVRCGCVNNLHAADCPARAVDVG